MMSLSKISNNLNSSQLMNACPILNLMFGLVLLSIISGRKYLVIYLLKLLLFSG